MNWTHVLTVFAVIATNLGTVIAFFIHMDKKTDENRFQLDKKAEENRIQCDKKIEEHRKETTMILLAIQTEMKDFHGRLCAIEERNKK